MQNFLPLKLPNNQVKETKGFMRTYVYPCYLRLRFYTSLAFKGLTWAINLIVDKLENGLFVLLKPLGALTANFILMTMMTSSRHQL